MESRTQDSRPRTQKNPGLSPRTDFPRTADPLEAKDRNAQGQGSWTTRASGLQKKVFAPRNRNFPRNFRRFQNKNKIKKVFAHKMANFCEMQTKKKRGHDLGSFLTNQKIELSSPEDRAFLRTCRLRGQGLGRDLQGQGLLNVRSQIFEDCTSAIHLHLVSFYATKYF